MGPELEPKAVIPEETGSTEEVRHFGLARKELIAALIEDSIGYLSPRSAEIHIGRWERGDETCFCERCAYVFKGNLQQCLEGAARRWQEVLSEDKRQQLLAIVEQVSKLDPIAQTTVGLMWPTTVL